MTNKSLLAELANISTGIQNLVSVWSTMNEHFLAFEDTLATQKCPVCPPDPKCFFILFAVYTIGTWFLGGREKFDVKACNEKLRSFCRSEEHNEIMETLKDQRSLADQYKLLTKPLQGGTFKHRANRMTILTAFIFGVIIWCQASHGGHSSQNQGTE